ncbi:MAG: hypothetical protein BRD41_00210 [Bacteroidetes bacterium QS_1_63_11]|nr:MAG: hypothetical protein BRD41_00210 [Bacteroidetes bacterium QS_1_63_11]
MEIRKVVSRGEPANRHLVYAPGMEEKRGIVETLVGMSNAEGGTVVVGAEVNEKGVPTVHRDVASGASFISEIETELQGPVQPELSCRTEQFRLGGSRFVSFTVSPSDRIRSIPDESSERPVFPYHSRSELEHLSGNDIDYFLELNSSRQR